MKTVKTANGFKKIEDWDSSLIPVQLRTILQDHRATLIDKLITGGLENYIDYKFNCKSEAKNIEEIKSRLADLRNSGIDIDLYRPIFEAVSRNEFTSLDNALFYSEIDKTIKSNLFQPQLFKEGKQVFIQ